MASESEHLDAGPLEPIPPTDYSAFVIQILKTSTNNNAAAGDTKIDQGQIRRALHLASSFLVTDTTTNPELERGISTWFIGLTQLVDIVVALHRRDELELETINAASRACSECWTASGNWRGLDECRVRVREVAGKLRNILDTNARTYRGERVYAP